MYGTTTGGGGGDDDVGRACHDHLTSMLELYDGGSDARCAPDLVTFSTVLNVLGRGGREDGRDRDGGGGEDSDADEGRAREILDIMLYLSGVDDYGGGGGRDGSGGGGGERDGDDDGAVVGIAPRRRPDFEFDVRPRNRHFNVVLALMAKRRRVDGATLERARRYVDVMELLRREEEEEEEEEESGIAGGRSRRRLPRSHGENGIAPEGGGGYFENPPVDHRGGDPAASLDDVGGRASLGDEWLSTSPPPMYGTMRSAPDIFTYNTLLNIAARAGRPEEAEGILKGMIKNSSDGTSGVRPDSISFNTVRPHSRVLSCVPRLASDNESALSFFLSLHSSLHWDIAVVIVLTISLCHPFETQVLSAWSKAKSHTGRLKTEQILDEMHKMAKDGDNDVRPDRVSVQILHIL